MTVVDLDGTLLAGNSFRWFTREVLRLSWRRNTAVAAAALCVMLVLRRLGLCSHRRLKWRLMLLADRVMTSEAYRRFALRLKERVNPAVLAMVADAPTLVVASAASAEYVAPFVELMGWKHYVATCRPKSGRFCDYTECRGETKVRAVRKLFPGKEIVMALTDHTDDLPLLAASRGRRILVNPSGATLATARMAGLEPEVLGC